MSAPFSPTRGLGTQVLAIFVPKTKRPRGGGQLKILEQCVGDEYFTLEPDPMPLESDPLAPGAGLLASG